MKLIGLLIKHRNSTSPQLLHHFHDADGRKRRNTLLGNRIIPKYAQLLADGYCAFALPWMARVPCVAITDCIALKSGTGKPSRFRMCEIIADDYVHECRPQCFAVMRITIERLYADNDIRAGKTRYRYLRADFIFLVRLALGDTRYV